MRILLQGVLLAVFCQSLVHSRFVGQRPTAVCWLERFSRMLGRTSWMPRCSMSYYFPEQCDVFGNCWCVNSYGFSRSITYHKAGTVNCYKTIRECKTTQVYTNCGSCPMSCSERETPKICTLQCRIGCMCPTGTFLNGDRCVTADECPAQKPTIKPVTCSKALNEVYQECAPPCDATCDQPRKACSTMKMCSKRCACLPRYVRNKDNVCVMSNQCPSVAEEPAGLKRCVANFCYCVDRSTRVKLPGTERPAQNFDLDCNYLGDCPSLMTFSACATRCPSTCANPMPKCNRACAIDCVCPFGTVRASETNLTCVAAEKCPAPYTCQYTRYSMGQSGDFITCENDGSWSATQCDRNGACWCVDAEGSMIANTRGVTQTVGMTSPLCEEARKCDMSKGMEFQLCAPSCDETCGQNPKPCANQLSCLARCACKPGYLLDATETMCIPNAQCKVKPVCDSSKNEVWNTCAKTCDKSCDKPNPPCANTRICKPRCSCQSNYVRNKEGVCIPSDQCPPQRRTVTETKCQMTRRLTSDPNLYDAFIPDCDETTGKYKPQQCYGFLNQCWCVDPESGLELPGSRGGPSWKFGTDCTTYGEPRLVETGSGDIPPPPFP